MHEAHENVYLAHRHDTHAIVHIFKQTEGNDWWLLYMESSFIFPSSSLGLMIYDNVLFVLRFSLASLT